MRENFYDKVSRVPHEIDKTLCSALFTIRQIPAMKKKLSRQQLVLSYRLNKRGRKKNPRVHFGHIRAA